MPPFASSNLQDLHTIQLDDLRFQLLIPHEELIAAIERIALRINVDYEHRELPVFLGVLNGCFMFMAELFKSIDFPCETSFVKIASYQRTASVGTCQELIGLSTSLQNRHVIIVEDIVETGGSIDHLMKLLHPHQPASVSVATLLFKPDAYSLRYTIDYAACVIGNRFVVGFGLDYNQQGRNLKHIYEISA